MLRIAAVTSLGLFIAAFSPSAWAGDGTTVRVIESPAVSQPGPFSRGGRTVVVPRTRIEIDEGQGGGPAVIPARSEITGKVRLVIDGDTLEVGGRQVRLYGIDAPDKGQTCTADGKAWPCGQDATFALAYETAEHWLRCEGKGRGGDGVLVAVCFVGPYDLGAIMVRKGWALADRQASPGYAGDEAAARIAHAGIWRGAFVPPRQWRDRHRTETRHPAAVPSAPARPSGCLIKGNINSRGERIYHVPGGRGYDETKIDTARGERWFCSEAAARAAGWRPPRP